MKILLDTHVFLWWVTDDRRLSRRAKDLISDGDNEILLSAASGWEMAIKSGLGKLKLPEDLGEFLHDQMGRNGIGGLPVLLKHAVRVRRLPDHHADPFDRLLVAQAQIEDLTLLTADKNIKKYDVSIAW
jgi:PIN domain nuclease of toxin-antitoxin system